MHALGKTHKTSCRENVPGVRFASGICEKALHPCVTRSHVLSIPFADRKRATLDFSVNISVSHYFTFCYWVTMRRLTSPILQCGRQVSNMCLVHMKLGHHLKATPILSMAVADTTLLISVTPLQLIRSLQSGLALPVARC